MRLFQTYGYLLSLALLKVHSVLGNVLGLQQVLRGGQLGLQVLDVADGVEDDIQVGFLAGVGHNASQSFHFFPQLGVGDFLQVLGGGWSFANHFCGELK